MITAVCNIAAVIAYAALGLWCGTRAIRAQRELAVLRQVKTSRKAQQQEVEAQGCGASAEAGVHDLLYLLNDEEKRTLVNMASPLPKWLGDKKISDLPAFDAAYYAGYALRTKSWHQLQSLVAASIGGLILARYLWSSLSDTSRAAASNHPNLVIDMVESGWHMASLQLPVFLGVFVLGWSWRKKQQSDDDDFFATILEDQARKAYARDGGADHAPM